MVSPRAVNREQLGSAWPHWRKRGRRVEDTGTFFSVNKFSSALVQMPSKSIENIRQSKIRLLLDSSTSPD